MKETFTTEQIKYKLKLYFIGGTIFSTELTIKGVEQFRKIIQNPKALKKSNYIITFGDECGVNIRNLNTYKIEESE